MSRSAAARSTPLSRRCCEVEVPDLDGGPQRCATVPVGGADVGASIDQQLRHAS